MENSPYNLELLDKYIAGSISAAEFEELKKDFSSLEELRREAKLHQAIEDGLRAAGNKETIEKLTTEIDEELTKENFYDAVKTGHNKAEISDLLDEIDEELEAENFYDKAKEDVQKSAEIKPLIPKWIKRSAAAAAILFITFKFIIPPSENTLEESISYEQTESAAKIQTLQVKIDEGKTSFAGGITIPQLKLLKQGLLSFQQKKYAASARELDDFLVSYPSHEMANFYRALCDLQSKNYEAAEQILSQKLYREQANAAKYFQALALLQLDQKAKAKLLLETLSKGNSPYTALANKLL